jgi:tetratricopeptide (TPR) repeat protein
MSACAALGGKTKVTMKRTLLAVIGVGVLVGLGFCVIRPQTRTESPAEPVAETAAVSVAPEPQDVEPVAARLEQPAEPVRTPNAREPASASVTSLAKPGLDAMFLSRTIDLLVSAQASYQQKQEAWKQLRDAGKLDQAIAELEERVASDPRVAEYAAALGEAYLKKCGTIHDVREQGILALQADKVFDTALSIDPSNWDAQFTKAVAMSYWPATLNKGEEVIQHFLTLIQQQEAETPQPQFAGTYAWLGDQYQKAGRSDDARAIWQRGAALFPADEKLRSRLTATP